MAAPPATTQGIWLQELVDNKSVWHFYPTSAATIRPGAAIEAPPPVTASDKIVVHPPGQLSAANGPTGPHFTYNVYNVYNYPTAPEAPKEEKKAVEAPKEEGIRLTEDDVRMDALLHEHAQAVRMLKHLQSVDYGAGDVYGRRYIPGYFVQG